MKNIKAKATQLGKEIFNDFKLFMFGETFDEYLMNMWYCSGYGEEDIIVFKDNVVTDGVYFHKGEGNTVIVYDLAIDHLAKRQEKVLKYFAHEVLNLVDEINEQGVCVQ